MAADNTGTTGVRRVLIAIDRSPHSERALRWYAEKLHRPSDSVALVNVMEPPELPLGFGMAGMAVAEAYTRAVDETVEAAKRLAEGMRDICRDLGVEKVRFLERVGHKAGPAIVQAADDEAADLVVMGTRGVGLIRRTFLGSVSDYVLQHSHRTLLIVPPPRQAPAAAKADALGEDWKLSKQVNSVVRAEDAVAVTP